MGEGGLSPQIQNTSEEERSYIKGVSREDFFVDQRTTMNDW